MVSCWSLPLFQPLLPFLTEIGRDSRLRIDYLGWRPRAGPLYISVGDNLTSNQEAAIFGAVFTLGNSPGEIVVGFDYPTSEDWKGRGQ